MRPLSILLALTLSPCALRAAAFPGGVLGPSGRVAYMSGATGIRAIDLSRGEIVATIQDAHRPLFVAGDRLYALKFLPRNAFDVVAFELGGNNARVFRTEVAGLPRWVVTAPAEGASFDVTFTRSKNVLLLTWDASTFSAGGLGSLPASSTGKRAAGEVRIDLDTGEVRLQPAAERPAPPREGAKILDRLAVRWSRRIGEQLYAVVEEELPESNVIRRQHRLVFRAWAVRTGKMLAAKELARGERLVMLTDLAGDRLWIREGAPPRAAGAQPRHHWSVFSAMDGERVARVPFVAGTHTATIIDGRAYGLSTTLAPTAKPGETRRGRLLWAADVEAGKELWSRALDR